MNRDYHGVIIPSFGSMVAAACDGRYEGMVADGIEKHRSLGREDAQSGKPCMRTFERLGSLWHAAEGWHYENAYHAAMLVKARNIRSETPMLPGFSDVIWTEQGSNTQNEEGRELT